MTDGHHSIPDPGPSRFTHIDDRQRLGDTIGNQKTRVAGVQLEPGPLPGSPLAGDLVVDYSLEVFKVDGTSLVGGNVFDDIA